MPNVFVNISDQEDSITRPINHAVAWQVLREMGFPRKAYLEYLGATEMAQTQGAQIGDPPNKNYFGTDTIAHLNVDETPVIERNYENKVLRKDENPYFKDYDLQVFIRPSYAMYKSTLSFELRFRAENEAMRWHKDILARSQLARTVLVHKAEYHIVIPQEILYILWQIHKTRESVVESGESFEAWFKRCADPRITTLSNQAGKGLTIVLAETQVNLQGSFDFTVTADKPIQDKDRGLWTVGFSYTFFYNRPIGSAATYPLVVMNKFLPENVLNTQEDYDLAREDVALGIIEGNMEYHSPKFSPIDRRYVPLRIPAYDTWSPKLQDSVTKMEFQVLVGVTPADLRSLCNLKEAMGDFKLSPETLVLLKKEYPFVTKRRRSVLDISLYINDQQAADSVLELDADLNLRATRDLELHKVYHLRFAYLVDLSLLIGEDKDRTINNGCQIYEVIKYLYPYLILRGLIPEPGIRCFWTPEEWKEIVTATQPSVNDNANPSIIDNRIVPTVGRFGIIAVRN